MSSANWEEIRRLAADFQRAQLTSTTLKLSERNCIEIVQKLNELKLIDILYTTDGKEYLTPVELSKEIKEELIVHGGRINLVDLQQALNVDLSHIESKVNELVGGNKSLNLVLGQIVSEEYLDGIAEEINDKLQDQGQVTLAEITKTYGLPGDFLSQAINSRLGTILKGQRDESDKNVIFTQSFVDRQRAKVRGAFTALTRPVNLSSVMQQFHLQERIFQSMVEELVTGGRLAGSLTKGQYVPDIYTRAQNEWVDSFYKQNGYLEYDAVARLGVPNVRDFIKKRLRNESPVYLNTCCVGQAIRDNLEAQIDEALATTGWCDVMPLLPSVFSTDDSAQLLQKLISHKSGAGIFCDYIVASESFINKCRAPFDSVMQTKAEKDAKSNPALFSKATQAHAAHEGGKEDRKEARRQKAAGGGKSGGGTQGRESKTKSTKKKYARGRGNQADDSDDDTSTATSSKPGEIEFLSIEDIGEHLKKFEALAECDEEFIAEIATQLYRPLRRQYQDIAKSVFLQTIGGATSSGRKKTHGDVSEKINGLWTNAKLFEKGLKLFPEESQVQLAKHLLKTVCTDIANMVFNTLAADHMMSVTDDTQITPEIRLKILAKIPEGKPKVVLNKLHNSLTAKAVDGFFANLDDACGSGMMEIVLKKADKKKERQIVFGHKQSLLEQLRAESEPAMVLHLASTVLFNVFTQTMIHAPGRSVPHIIAHLRPHLAEDKHVVLVSCQDLVMQQLKLQADSSADENEMSDVTGRLTDLVPKVKDIALTTKKSSSAAAANED